jgi:membrane protease YdiL (CAAX protease family)
MGTMKQLLGERLQFDWRAVLVTVMSTLLLMVDAYHRLTPIKYYDRLILYLAIPLVTILFVYREHPREYGFSLGNWKAGILLTAAGVLIAAPLLWLTARQTAMQQYYGSQLTGLPWTTFLDLVGWEFLFRGFILFTYTRRYGPDGLWLQAVPFALAHIGKPEIETLSTIFGGFVFGWLAYRTRSFLYPFLLHWFVATFTILAAAGIFG